MVVVVVVVILVVIVCAVAVIVFDLLLSSITVVIPSKFYPGLPLYQSMTPKTPHWSTLCSQFCLDAKLETYKVFIPWTHLLASSKIGYALCNYLSTLSLFSETLHKRCHHLKWLKFCNFTPTLWSSVWHKSDYYVILYIKCIPPLCLLEAYLPFTQISMGGNILLVVFAFTSCLPHAPPWSSLTD